MPTLSRSAYRLCRAPLELAGRAGIGAVVLAAFAACLAWPGSAQNRTAPARASDANAYCETGIQLFGANRLDEALQAFRKAHSQAPHDPTPLSYTGLIWLREGRYAQALQPLAEAERLDAKDSGVHLNLGNALDKLRRYGDALAQFQSAARLAPRSAAAYYDMGGVYCEMQNLPQAIRMYRSAAVLARQDPEIQNNLGYALEAAGHLPAALAAYRRAVQLDPQNATYLLNLALAYRSLAQIYQSSPIAWKERAAQRYWLQSRIALSRAAAANPQDVRIRETYATTLEEMKRDSDAMAQWEKAADLAPAAYGPLLHLGMVEARLGRYRQASEALQRALNVQPNKPEALRVLAYAQFKAGRYAAAAASYELLTRATPNDMDAWTNLGAALQQDGRESDAMNVLQTAIHRGGSGPQLAPLHRAVGYYLLLRGDAQSLDQARKEYELAAQGQPSSPDAYNGLGLVDQKKGALAQAVADFKRAVALNPADADAYNNIGVVYELQGDKADAESSYRKALAADPGNRLAAANLSRLQGNPTGK